jgi:NADH-quinone oxidoreductase subunit L
MAIPLLILAVGSVLAGYVGVPHALGGHNRIEGFLEPSFHPAHVVRRTAATTAGGFDADQAANFDEHATAAPAATPEHAPAESAAAPGEHAAAADTGTELTLMAVSSAIALAGIGLAVFFFGGGGQRAAAVGRSMSGLHRVLLNKYYVDELYDAALVQPTRRLSESVLWKKVDAGVIDGLVNGTGALVRGSAAVVRLAQTGSVRAYAASLFLGVLLVLAYYLAR